MDVHHSLSPEGDRSASGRLSRGAVAGIAAVIVLIVGIVFVVAQDDPPSRVDAGTGETQGGSWTQLPDPPLSPRVGASAAWTGSEVIVAGGWDFRCPPTASCSLPTEDFMDGAAFDPAAGTWRPIADAPAAFHGIRPAVVDGKAFFLIECSVNEFSRSDDSPVNDHCPGTDEPVTLLRYDPVGDSWTQLPGPPNGRSYALATAGSSLIAHAGSDEGGEVPDWQFDVAAETWTELPDDPLPPLFDRSTVSADGGQTVLLFGDRIGPQSEPGEESIVGARLDLTTMQWSELPPSPGSGYRAWGVDDRVVLEPHFGGSGSLFDPATSTWSSLPSPTSPSFDSNNVAGTVGRDDAVYVDASGWVFDADRGQWLEVQPIDDRDVFPFSSVTAVDRDLFVFGGARWGSSADELLGDAWLWRAPVRADEES